METDDMKRFEEKIISNGFRDVNKRRPKMVDVLRGMVAVMPKKTLTNGSVVCAYCSGGVDSCSFTVRHGFGCPFDVAKRYLDRYERIHRADDKTLLRQQRAEERKWAENAKRLDQQSREALATITSKQHTA